MQTLVTIDDAINYDCSLNRGLVSWWIALPDQQRGVYWRDLTRKNDGTLTALTPSEDWGGPLGRPGGFGSLGFNDDGYVSLSSASSIGSSGTLSGWIRPNKVYNSSYDEHVWGGDAGTPAEFVFRKFGDNKLYIGWNAFSGDDRVILTTSATNWPQNTWTHSVVTWVEGGSTIVYQDGVSIGSSTGTSTGSLTAGFMFGFSPTYSVHKFDGQQDSWRLYNRALSAEEVSFLYREERQGYPDTLNWFPLPRYAPEQAAAGTTVKQRLTLLGVGC